MSTELSYRTNEAPMLYEKSSYAPNYRLPDGSEGEDNSWRFTGPASVPRGDIERPVRAATREID